jgi:hypothetical protein
VAIVYLRQSSAAQVEHNRESTDRQYALVNKAADLGWPADKVIVIDEDLGVPQRSPERTRLRSPELTQRVRMGLCSGGRISRYLAYMKVSIPPSRPGFRKTLRQPAVESLPCPRLGPGMAAGTARRRAAHSVIEGRLTPFQA